MNARNLSIANHVARRRRERGWSQLELASRSRVSRAEVSAIETGRVVPATSTALALARALECSVESLFTLPQARESEASWAWEPRDSTGRFWLARVGERALRFPVEPQGSGLVPHDGTFRRESIAGTEAPEPTLVVAGCDPAVGLLGRELLRAHGVRLLAFNRASRVALSLLERGLVHAAGLHWWEPSPKRDANASVVASTLGPGFRLLHLARWEEGVVLGPSVGPRSRSGLVRARIRWVGREEGSGAKRCLDRLLGARKFPHLAEDHRGVAQAIRSGWADAGVAVRLAAEEAGLDFLSLQSEDYEICYAEEHRNDAPIAGLRKVLNGSSLRKIFRELPGYDVTRMGEERAVA